MLIRIDVYQYHLNAQSMEIERTYTSGFPALAKDCYMDKDYLTLPHTPHCVQFHGGKICFCLFPSSKCFQSHDNIRYIDKQNQIRSNYL